MAYYGRRRASPYAAERREREQKEQERIDRDKAALSDVLSSYRRIKLRGEAASHAWKQPEIRSFTTGRTNDGSITTILRGDEAEGELYLQEPGFPSWNFSRLVPKYQTLRREEEDTERDRGRKSMYKSRERTLRRKVKSARDEEELARGDRNQYYSTSMLDPYYSGEEGELRAPSGTNPLENPYVMQALMRAPLIWQGSWGDNPWGPSVQVRELKGQYFVIEGKQVIAATRRLSKAMKIARGRHRLRNIHKDTRSYGPYNPKHDNLEHGPYNPKQSSSRDPANPLDFNTKLSKALSKLKKDAGATGVRQNYRGTGSQSFRRQLWVHFKSGAVIDLWLEKNRLGLGGVVMNRPPGSDVNLSTRTVPYEDKSPEEVYREALAVLKPWANPASRDKRRPKSRSKSMHHRLGRDTQEVLVYTFHHTPETKRGEPLRFTRVKKGEHHSSHRGSSASDHEESRDLHHPRSRKSLTRRARATSERALPGATMRRRHHRLHSRSHRDPDLDYDRDRSRSRHHKKSYAHAYGRDVPVVTATDHSRPRRRKKTPSAARRHKKDLPMTASRWSSPSLSRGRDVSASGDTDRKRTKRHKLSVGPVKFTSRTRYRDADERDRGWWKQPRRHAVAATAGWETRKKSKKKSRRDADERDRGWWKQPRRHAVAATAGWEKRKKSKKKSRRDADERDRGWWKQKRRHSVAATEGWEKRKKSKRRGSRSGRDESLSLRDRGWYGDPKRHRMAASMGWHNVARPGWHPEHPKYKGEFYKTAGTAKRGKRYLKQVEARSGKAGHGKAGGRLRERKPVSTAQLRGSVARGGRRSKRDMDEREDFEREDFERDPSMRRRRHHRTSRFSRFGYQ